MISPAHLSPSSTSRRCRREARCATRAARHGWYRMIRAWLADESPVPLLVEPFAGGAIVSLTAVMEGLAERAHMVDLDHDLATFWRVALDHSRELLQARSCFRAHARVNRRSGCGQHSGSCFSYPRSQSDTARRRPRPRRIAEQERREWQGCRLALVPKHIVHTTKGYPRAPRPAGFLRG